jgi:hypothetical protein
VFKFKGRRGTRSRTIAFVPKRPRGWTTHPSGVLRGLYAPRSPDLPLDPLLRFHEHRVRRAIGRGGGPLGGHHEARAVIGPKLSTKRLPPPPP